MAAQSYDRLEGVIWYDGKLVPWQDANLHVLSHGLHYASCVFEGERAYGGKIFKSQRARRASEALGQSCSTSRSPIRSTSIDAAKQLVVDKNGKKKPMCARSPGAAREMMGVSAQNNTIHLAIATWEWPSYFDPEQRLKGIRLDLAEYRRPDPKTAPCLAKAAGLYMICTISKHRAERRGYADAMMLDWQGRVAECTGANIFFVKDGKIHTPIADCFLDGITRQTVIALARKRGFEVIERRIMPDELIELLRVLHHRLGGGSHRGVGDRRPMEFQSRRHHQAADGRLHRGGEPERQGRGGVKLRLILSEPAQPRRLARMAAAAWFETARSLSSVRALRGPVGASSP